MEIHLRLHSILRDKLPPEMKGRTVMQITEDTKIKDLLEILSIKRSVVISVNGEHVAEQERVLQNGDEVWIFVSLSGG